MTSLPPWPAERPRCGPVTLRPSRDDDVAAVLELATDPYVPLIGSLPAHADDEQARAWIGRQHDRWTTGAGFSVAAADLDDRMVGTVGLHLRDLAEGRATAGYAVLPARRGHGYAAAALTALTAVAWTVEGLDRVELHVEPWNTASVRTAERAGYRREGLLRGHTGIGGTRRDMLLYTSSR